MNKTMIRFLMAIACTTGFCGHALAASLSATYTSSALPGNKYLLDFTLHNDIPAQYAQKAYFWGVDLPYSASQGSPTGWYDWGAGTSTFNTVDYGGSDRDYASLWLTGTNNPDAVASGGSLSGFTVPVKSIPSEIHYFIFSYGKSYAGTDAFNAGANPGFEGVLQGPAKVTPEPISSTLFLLGGTTWGLWAYRRKKKS